MTLGNFQKKIKLAGIVLLFVSVLAGTVVMGERASTYFAKASECPAKNVKAAQVTSNGVVINWTSDDKTQGRVEYGTDKEKLIYSTPEGSSGVSHNVPITLLTPNTVYYYLITIGKTRCDSTNQVCTDNCVPWTFTTSPSSLQDQIAVPLPSVTVKVLVSPTRAATISGKTQPSIPVATPTGSLSAFCQQVKLNLGKNNKQYDIDSNGIINGLDVVKCQKAGK